MAFMALFFWLIIFLALIAQAGIMLEQILGWIKLNAGLFNWVAAGILVVNILAIIVLVRVRAKQKRSGKLSWNSIQQHKGWKKFGWLIWTLALYLWPIWAAFLALLCVLYLVIQPIRFLP